MAGGDPDDVLRSLRRHVALILGAPPWEVRLQRTRVEDEARPEAVVEETAPGSFRFARIARDQGDVQLAQSYAVSCYPDIEASAADSRLAAGQLRTLLLRAFSRGLVTSDVPPVDIGGPFAFPIFDFEPVPVTGTPVERTGPVEPYGFARIDPGLSARAIQDPVDEVRFTVVVTLTASWWAAGRIPEAGLPVVARMPPTGHVH